MDDRLEQLLEQLETPCDERQRIRDAVADQKPAEAAGLGPPPPV